LTITTSANFTNDITSTIPDFKIEFKNDESVILYKFLNDNSNITLQPISSITLNTWVHILLKLDFNQMTVSLFKNGSLLDNLVRPIQKIPSYVNNNYLMYPGGRNATNDLSQRFNGYVRSIRLWK